MYLMKLLKMQAKLMGKIHHTDIDSTIKPYFNQSIHHLYIINL